MADERKDPSEVFSQHEKAAVREELRAFMRKHPARAPLSLRFVDSIQQALYSPRLQFAVATLGLIVVTGSGTAFAAQNALPGNPLYGLKTNVEEPIMGAFATSPEAKATWSEQLAARRLSEAEQLAVQNRLTPEAASTIAGGLNQATESFDETVATLATSTGNAATVAMLASNMEATLAANTQVLNEIANAVPTAAPALQPLLSNVQERTVSLNSARTAMDVAAAQTNDQQVMLAAQAALGAAEGQVNQVVSNAHSAPVSTSSPAGMQVQVAQQELNSGQQNFSQGNYAAALESLQAASVEAHAAQLNLSIGQQLGASAGIELPSATTSSAFSAVIGANAATSAPATSTTSAPPHHHHSSGSTTDQLQLHL